MSKCIVIVGMHRAGTSLVARIFHEWGVNLGEDLMGPDGANTEGFYENWDFVKLNNALIHEAGGSWNYPKKAWSHGDARAKVLVEYSRSELWGWKDNRTAFTFKAYEPYLEDVLFVRCRRKREDIISSLSRTHLRQFDKKDRTIEYLSELCDMYEAAIDEIIVGYPTLVVEYDNLHDCTFFNKELKHF